MKKWIWLFALVIATSAGTFAQNKTQTSVEQIWLGYFTQTRFSNKWGVWVDAHLRTKENFVNNLSQGLVRLGLTYYLNNDAKLTAGYTYVNHFPSDNHKTFRSPSTAPGNKCNGIRDIKSSE